MLTKFSFISSWINRLLPDKLNILSHSTHERHNSVWAKTLHNFYFMPSAERHSWNEKNCPIPPNIKFIDNIYYGQDISYDCYVSQTRQQAEDPGRKICETFGLPHIKVFHTLRSATGLNYKEQHWREFAEASPADYHVFITEAQAQDWYYQYYKNPVVIRHGIDGAVFGGWQPGGKYILNVSNDFIGRGYVMGWDVWENVCNGMPVRFVGDTLKPDGSRLSEAAPSLDHLAAEYRQCGVYFSCTRLSSVSTSMLEALMSGTPVVAFKSFGTEYFNDGEHCFVSDDPLILKDRLQFCLDNPTEAALIGQRGRNRVMELFGVAQHVAAWNKLLYMAIDERVNPQYV